MNGKFLHLNDGDEWMVAEDIPNIDFAFCSIWLHSFVNNMKESTGMNYSKILGVFKGTDMSFYYGKKSCLDFTLNLVNKIAADPDYGIKINENIVSYSDALEDSANKIPKNLSSLSNEELWKILEEHFTLHTELYEWGWLSNATDMFYPEFTELLKNYLRTKTGSEDKVNAYFITLTSPTEKSKEALQHEEFLRIAVAMEKGQRAEAKILLEDYYAKYSPISALWVGEPQPMLHYEEELNAYLKQGKSPSQELKNIEEGLETLKRKKQKLLDELNVDEKHARLFDVFGGFMLSKVHRRYAQLRSNYLLRSVYAEIARRFGITLDQARFLTQDEYEKLLVEGNFDVSILAEREKFCVLYAEEGADLVSVGGEAKALSEKAVLKIDSDVKELKGQCACLGYAKGIVRIILEPSDLPKMRQGDVLVAIATNPDVVPAMKKASAIVTEQGGVTSHAAIVSRELGIPCVIGTKIATRVLKDGDLVEVDANKGIVRKVS
ncbi:MAG: PEP-utilizing enzyme [Candidatus Micrarchaeota archaeon]